MKAVAIVAVLAVLFVCSYLGVVLAWHAVRRIREAQWQRAKLRARWEEHTTVSPDCTADGVPIAEVAVRRVARHGHRSEVLETRPVAKVTAPDAFAPELIEAQALAWSRADTLNQLQGTL